jgi:hypothetical protein
MPLITFLFLAYFFPETTGRHVTEDCQNLEVTYTVEKLAAEKSKVVVTVKGGKQPYRYFFFNKTSGLLTWELQNNYYIGDKNSLPKSFKVLDAEGCIKTVELNESVK